MPRWFCKVLVHPGLTKCMRGDELSSVARSVFPGSQYRLPRGQAAAEEVREQGTLA
jgi:hypothetical protein